TPNVDGLYEISDPILADTVLDSAKEYLLTEVVYVGEPGNTNIARQEAKLTIPAGTTIYGVVGLKDGSNNVIQEPGTLVITRAGPRPRRWPPTRSSPACGAASSSSATPPPTTTSPPPTPCSSPAPTSSKASSSRTSASPPPARKTCAASMAASPSTTTAA